MPSQEEHLDDLLNNMQEGSMHEELAEMTEDEIDRILAANKNQNQDVSINSDNDLMDLLSADESDNELNDIYDMLKKSDNNEALDDSLFAEIPDMASGVLEDEEDSSMSPRQRKAAEKKRLKEEKKKAKEAAKQAKKEEKERKKAMKGAGKAPASQKAKQADDSPEKQAGISLEKNTDNEQKSEMDVREAHPDREAIDETDEIFENMAALDQGLLDSLEKDADEMDSILHDKNEIANKNETTPEGGKQAKKGLLGKVIEFLFAEDEEENEDEAGALHLSDENEEILKELDDKKSKKKDKKAKKGKKADKGEGEEDSEESEDKKPKKPKKEKKPKLKKADEQPEKKLSKKRVILVFAFCFTICAVILVLSIVAVDYSDKHAAAVAFHKEDYETCYQDLYGKRFLNETQQVMYGKSESILRARLWMREYEILSEEGDDLKTLDSLLQSVHDYPTLLDYSSKFNASGEVVEIYNRILSILDEKYHLSEQQAIDIGNEPDDILYTKKVKAALKGELETKENDKSTLDEKKDEKNDTKEDETPKNPPSKENKYEIEIPIVIDDL